MGNKSIKDPYIRVLLERREEIKAKINKLEAEYSAIGELIKRDYNHTHPFKPELNNDKEER